MAACADASTISASPAMPTLLAAAASAPVTAATAVSVSGAPLANFPRPAISRPISAALFVRYLRQMPLVGWKVLRVRVAVVCDCDCVCFCVGVVEAPGAEGFDCAEVGCAAEDFLEVG